MEKYKPEKQNKAKDNEESKGMTRREFLKKTVSATASLSVVGGLDALTGESSDKYKENYTPTRFGNVQDVTKGHGEEVEDSKVESENLEQYSEKYDKEIMRHRLRISLAFNEVLFFDTNNEPVGSPVTFENFVIDRNGLDYLLAPGPVNDAGLLTQGIAREWSRYVRSKIQEENPDRNISSMEHVTNDFIRAYNLQREPDLRKLIDEGKITRYVDIVKYFADRRPVDEEGRSRIEYVKDRIQIPNVPEVVQDELVKLIPGLCAQESKFDPYVTSSQNAQGVFQFIPSTWVNDYHRSIESITDIREQTEVAGLFFADIYRQILHFAGSDNLNKIKDNFPDEETYQRQFFVPLMLNAYNAGSRRIGEGVADYIKNSSYENIKSGKDTFIELADYMYESKNGVLNRYGIHARNYVPQIYAQALELDETKHG